MRRGPGHHAGPAQILASLEDSNLLLVPLDRQRRWYRYHQLFHELLLAELGRREPELVPELHARAASWCEANGLPESAIDHAQAAGDPDRVARLVWKLALPAYGAGRVDTTRRWFGWFEDQGLLGRYRSVAMLGAWLHALVGEPVAAERWADAAEQGPVAGTLPDGSTVQSYLALLRALLCRNGVDRMRADTQAALAELSPGSQWRPTAQLLEGICYLLAGQADRADPILAHAAEVATEARALPAAAIALAERSLVAMHHQDWTQAATLAEQAQGVVRAGALDGYVASALVHAALARVAVHQGDVRRPKSRSRGPLGCGPCSPTPCPTSLSRPCWSWAGSAWPWTTPPAPGWCCAKPATSSGGGPTSASSPARSTSCGPSSTPAVAGPWGSRR